MTPGTIRMAALASAVLAAWIEVSAAHASGSTGDAPNWDRAAALQAAAQQANPGQLDDWITRIDAGQASTVLTELQASPATGSPAFELQLYRLAQSLAEAPLDPGSDQLLAWLQDYTPRVRVAHEESAAHGVPLFAVAAAAQGAATERQRRRAGLRSTAMLADPPRWIATFLSAGATQRRGMERALDEVQATRLQPLAHALQAALAAEPVLAGPAGLVAGRLADSNLLLQALWFSQGADTTRLLREAAWRLDAAERSQLFDAVAQPSGPHPRADESGKPAQPTSSQHSSQASMAKAALGISILGPGLQDDAGVSQRLLQLLDDPQLGAAAALALAGHPDPGVQASLKRKTLEPGPGGRRAALALGETNAATLQRDRRSDPQ